MVRLDVFLNSLKMVRAILEPVEHKLVYFINDDEVIHECFFDDLCELNTIGGYLTRHFEVLDTKNNDHNPNYKILEIVVSKI